MFRRVVLSILVFAVAISALISSAIASEKAKIAPICKQCHTPDEKILRGTLSSVSQKAETIQIQIGPTTWLVRYDENTKLVGAETLAKIPKEKEIAVSITEKEGTIYATSVSVKPPARLPEDKLIKTDALAKLLSENADIVLIDSRPAPRYYEGHILGAISIYDAEFEKHIEKLPKEKDKLIIFYCGGVT